MDLKVGRIKSPARDANSIKHSEYNMIHDFKPHPIVRGGHLQTLVGKFAGQEKPIIADTLHRIQVSGGDEMAIEINKPTEQDNGKLLVLFHGLGGCSESPYMLRMCRKAVKRGYTVARVNHRGCGRHTAECRGIYHSGSVGDMLASLQFLANLYSGHSIYPVAFSLSGTILLNTLSVHSEEMKKLIHKAIPVSAPIDLETSSLALDHWKNVKYNIFYTYFLKQQAELREKKYTDSIYPDVGKIKSLREFDQVYTAKVGGFRDRLDYYTTWSPSRHSQNITAETHVLLATDDPIVPKESIANFKPSSSVKLYVTDSGGHLGYIAKEKSEYQDYRWMDTFIFKVID